MKTNTLAILGRQPELGLAELEALVGSANLEAFGEAALLSVDSDKINHANLGGAIKLGRSITTLPSAGWNSVAATIHKSLDTLLQDAPEGKLTIGLSAYGFKTTPRQIGRLGLQLKKALKTDNRSVRIVPNTSPALTSAQIQHNSLTGGSGIELLIVTDGRRTCLARTYSVQDIANYTKRDFGRPKRDARVGMLPPKLAQMMLNLAKPPHGTTVLDPFCGTGVVLLEAALQGYRIEGSDINQRMVDYTQANLDWLAQTYRLEPKVTSLAQADATAYQWYDNIRTVVCETYLGRPLSTLPDRQTLQMIIQDCNTIVRKFLTNLRPQLAPNARCCIAVPAWRVGRSFTHLPVVDDLKRIGYNRVSFMRSSGKELLYHRPDQIVARELLVITPS